MRNALFSAILFLLFTAACTQQAGPLSLDVGGACGGDSECNPESVCQEGAQFPDGMCTIECNAQADCIPSTVCGELGICLMVCANDSDCRDGYDCAPAERPGLTPVNVCIREIPL